MSKFWRVCWYEYTRHVLRKRFLFGLLSMPLIIAVIVGISILTAVLSGDSNPLGYVDHSGFLANPRPLPPPSDIFTRQVKIVSYPDESTARSALDKGDIQAYYVLPDNYPQSNMSRLVFQKVPDSSIQRQFTEFIRVNLLASQPPDIAKRIYEGTTFTIQSMDGSRTQNQDDIAGLLLPFLTGILFMIVILSSGGYLMQAVVEEKENRTMEIIVTSVSPEQLMAGKIVGDLSIGLTMLLAWTAFIVAAILVGRNYFDWMQRLKLGPDYLALMLVILLPAFVMVASMMAALGATVTESREAQQISGLFTLPIMVPYWFSYSLMTNPNGPLALILSFFPLTAPVTLTMRAAFTQIPAWQLAVNIIIIVIFAIVSLWLAARAFRLGMLRYGKRLSWREVFGKAG